MSFVSLVSDVARCMVAEKYAPGKEVPYGVILEMLRCVCQGESDTICYESRRIKMSTLE